MLDFRKNNNNDILKALNKLTILIEKEFFIVKETKVSSVYCVEDFP